MHIFSSRGIYLDAVEMKSIMDKIIKKEINK